jgi:putative zinc finger/helix-turn-helix YgiT family protein
MKEGVENHKYDTCGLPGVVLTGVTVARCPRCNEHVVEIPDVSGLHELLAMTVASKSASLTGTEVRFLRKWLGWTGTRFAAWMGADPSTVSRWESGKQRMSKQAESLIRLYALKTVSDALLSIEDDVAPLREARLHHTRKGWVLDAAA